MSDPRTPAPLRPGDRTSLDNPRIARKLAREGATIRRSPVAMLGDVRHGRVVDIGGSAADIAVLRRRVGRAGHVVCVDRDREPLVAGRASVRQGLGPTANGGAVGFVQASAARLALPADSCVAARVDRVLSHVDDPMVVLREVRRVVRPGGTVVVVEPDHESHVVDEGDDVSLAFVTAAVLRRHAVRFANPRAPRRLAGQLMAAGFARVDVHVSSFGFPSLAEVDRALGVTELVADAVADGEVSADEARRWHEALAAKSAAGTFTWWGLGAIVSAVRPG